MDPTEYDPNSRDSTDDPDFVGTANHIGNLNKMVVGDNDHGDSKPTLPMYSSVLADNAALREDLKDSLNAHDEMRLEIVRLTKERDEARREVCRLMSMFNAENSVEIAASRSWDCFKKEKTP